nr:protein IWS1 homolog isoform X3 [Paramormyrops kingsleyae]
MAGEEEFFSGARSDEGGGTPVQDELAAESLDEDDVNSAVRPFEGVSRPTASDRNEVDLLKRRGSSEDDEPKQLINDNDTEEQMSVQRGQSGEADCETEARKQNIEIVSDDRMVGRDKGHSDLVIQGSVPMLGYQCHQIKTT